MKKKTKEFTDMTAAELAQQLDEKKRELFDLRLQQVSGQLENPLRIRAVRRIIARIKTIMNQAANAERLVVSCGLSGWSGKGAPGNFFSQRARLLCARFRLNRA